MGAKQSTNVNASGSVSSTSSPRIGLNGSASTSSGYPGSSGPSTSTRDANGRRSLGGTTMAEADWRSRARSLGNVINGHQLGASAGQPILTANGLSFAVSGSPDSDTDNDEVPFNRFIASSLPVRFVSFSHGIKCPVCSKNVLPDDVECHLVMCLTKPRISYNEDVLMEDKGECVICLEELNQGDTIARLPCLCIYHKTCIDNWFDVNRSCPEHPAD